VASALGIERVQEQRHLDLAGGLLFAVRLDEPGQPQSDYHTAQVPPARKNRRFATRGDELAVDKTELKTILSRREFRTGAISTIALWPAEDHSGVPPLAEIKAALQQPFFTPFVGRKANVLMLPMAPRIVDAPDVESAFSAFDESVPKAEAAFRVQYPLSRGRSAPRIYAEVDAVATDRRERIEQRRDVPESRAKWRFGLRDEALLKVTEGGRT